MLWEARPGLELLPEEARPAAAALTAAAPEMAPTALASLAQAMPRVRR